MKEVASLRYGVIFKKAFRVPEIFTAFVRDVVGVQMEIDHVEMEKSFEPPIGRVAVEFDLYAEDKKIGLSLTFNMSAIQITITDFCTISARPCWNKWPTHRIINPN